MSLRIKKGSKVWGPKAPVVRRPGGVPSVSSSARPSVERQSQTPGPVPKPAEILTVSNVEQAVSEQTLIVEPSTTTGPNDPAPTEPSAVVIDTNSNVQNKNTTVTQGTKELKRTERTEEETIHISAKRTRIEAPIPPQSQPVNRHSVEPLSSDSSSQSQTPNLPSQTSSTDTVAQPQTLNQSVLPSSSDSSAKDPKPNHSVQQPSPDPVAQFPKPIQPVLPSPPHSSPEDQTPNKPTQPSSSSSDRPLAASPQATQTSSTPFPSQSEASAAETQSFEDGGVSRPVLETRQDIASSIYPDPELSSGLGPAGSIPSTASGIPQSVGLGAAGEEGSTATQIAQAPQIVTTAALDSEATPVDAAEEPAAGTKKKVVRRKKVQPAAEEDDDVRATIEMQLNRPRRIAGAKRTRKKKEDKDKPKGRRGMTPEGAEQEQINPSTMKMADLCRDIRIGVKSSNHDMIKRRIMEKKTRAKLAKTNPELIPVVESTEPAAEQAEEPVSSAPNGPRMRIVDGQIVLAESSLQLDRHKRAEAESEVMLEVEENEFSHMTTSGSYMKRERTQAWDDVDNATFYQGLAQFGTDFETIAKLFPSRSRRQIKLKFNNEERKNPLKINQILMGKPQSIDLVGFEEMSGLKLETVEMIERERAELAAEQEREVQAREREKSEAELKKKKDIADRSAAARKLLNGVDDDLGAELGDGSGKENLNGRKKKGKGRNRNPHGRGDGGEEIQVLGTVE